MATHTLTVTIQQADGAGKLLARRDFTVVETAPSAGEFIAGILTTVNLTTITLPVAQVREFIFRNTHASAKITVTWTPQGGAEAVINQIGPGGTIVLFMNTAAAAGLGFSSLKLQSDTLNGTYEMWLAG